MAFRFSSLNKRVQLGVAIGIPALIALLLGWLIYDKLGTLGPDEELPAFVRREVPDSLWDQIKKKREEIDQQEQIIRRKQMRERELESLQKDIALAHDMLPREKEVLEFVQQLSELARKIPSDIGIVKVGTVNIIDSGAGAGTGGRAGQAAANELPATSWEVEIDGDINGIIKYIDSIEKYRRYMAVTNISITPGKLTADKEKQLHREPHHARLTMVTFTYTPKKGGRP
jgi:hypothetical protein